MLMTFKVRVLKAFIFFFITLCSATSIAQTSPIKLMVGFPAGGGTDAIARLLGDQLSQTLGVPVIIENRAGAGGQIAAQALKNAPADGSVLFLSHDHTISILPLINKNAGFEPAKDFLPVAGVASFANGIALSASLNETTLDQFIQSIRTQHQGKASLGVPAPQSVPEFLVKVLARQYKLDLIAVPYKGSAPMIADMLGNQIPAGVASVPDFIEYQKARKLRMVAVMGSQRQTILPDTPTFTELGIKGFEDLPYYGIFAPKGTPPATIQRYNDALKKILEIPNVQQRLVALGLTIEYMSSQKLYERERAYSKNWARIIAESGLKLE
ncbi:MAG: Bug family tripartite tricarboxylate transporter substrate binding protein [Burkholderiaceae bacterium]|nr:Bug family tripartite tricarboxylate transporter substrate binding protein [Burkholderiaceae bacterium]